MHSSLWALLDDLQSWLMVHSLVVSTTLLSDGSMTGTTNLCPVIPSVLYLV